MLVQPGEIKLVADFWKSAHAGGKEGYVAAVACWGTRNLFPNDIFAHLLARVSGFSTRLPQMLLRGECKRDL